MSQENQELPPTQSCRPVQTAWKYLISSYSSWRFSWQPWPFWQLHGRISSSKNQSQPMKVIKVGLIEYLNDEGKVCNLKTHNWWRVKCVERV